MKLYFNKVPDFCHTINSWRDYMKANNLSELELFEAKKSIGSGYFYCKEFGEAVEVGICGKDCHAYKPNNGIKGRCKHYGYCYEMTDKKIVIKNPHRIGQE